MKRNAQVWSFDFTIGFILFLVIIFFGVKLAINLVPNESYDNLYRESSQLSATLITQGYPLNWNTTTVIIPGIADNSRINETKLREFDKLTYGKSKILLHTSNEYIFYFKNKTSIINTTKCIRGYNIQTDNLCKPNLTSIQVSNLVKFERLVILNSSLVSMIVYAWN